jgi:hypothetical protein
MAQWYYFMSSNEYNVCIISTSTTLQWHNGIILFLENESPTIAAVGDAVILANVGDIETLTLTATDDGPTVYFEVLYNCTHTHHILRGTV